MKDLDTKVTTWIENQSAVQPEVELSVIIPAYNEYRRLPVMLMESIEYLDRRVSQGTLASYELIIVDDGSSDNTEKVVRTFETFRTQLKLIRIPKNSGKGHAVRFGMLNGRGQRLLFADADGATQMIEIEKLEAALNAGADIAIGSRALASKDATVKTVLHRRVLGRVFNTLVNILAVPKIADTQCGFKLFTRAAARFLFTHQTADRFSFDVEILLLAQKVGLTIAEIPVNWTNIPGSKVNLVFDSLAMFRDIVLFRFKHRNITKESYIVQ